MIWILSQEAKQIARTKKNEKKKNWAKTQRNENRRLQSKQKASYCKQSDRLDFQKHVEAKMKEQHYKLKKLQKSEDGA